MAFLTNVDPGQPDESNLDLHWTRNIHSGFQETSNELGHWNQMAWITHDTYTKVGIRTATRMILNAIL